MSYIQNRYDFVYYFDCLDGNPNGDPDNDNRPRTDDETGHGLVSDVCLKRKVRDYIFHSQQEDGKQKEGFDIFVMSGTTLESNQKLPYEDEELKSIMNAPVEAENEQSSKKKGKGGKKDAKTQKIALARAWMCKKFYDIRAFGAVMSTTDFNCGQVRGPIQLTFARSVNKVWITDHTITRQAFTRDDKAEASKGETEMGHKQTIAYGLYRAHGFVSPAFSKIFDNPERPRGTGFSEEDLDLFWKALCNMFDLDHSAARGLMACRKLVIFKHKEEVGNAPAHKLFDMVSVRAKDGIVAPRSFDDYEITLPSQDDLPTGIEMIVRC
jgi:CRISPR-associated protein Csd2